jgi:hypothetical protein
LSDGPWWVEPAATCVGIIIGAAGLLWQQRAASRAELKLDLYDKLRVELDQAATAVSAAGMYAFGAIGNVRVQRNLLAAGQPAAPPLNRIPKFIELNGEALNRSVAVIYLLESYEIVSEHFPLFRAALGCAHHDVWPAFHAASQSMYGVLPVDVVVPPVPGGVAAQAIVTQTPQPSVPAVVNFNEKCDAYWKLMNTLGCYIHDIKIEAQNLLLCGLFRRRVPARRPADPRMWVLRTDDPEYLSRLRRHFLEEHPSAVEAKRVDTETRAAFGPLEGAPDTAIRDETLP